MYPRVVYKSKEEFITVTNETEEYNAGVDGYEKHWNPEINEIQKGTDKEILRDNPDPLTSVAKTVIEKVIEPVKEIVKKTRKRKVK